MAARERRRDKQGRTVRVQRVRKLADYLDGIDLSTYDGGDVLDLPRREAELLIAGGWAVPLSDSSYVQGSGDSLGDDSDRETTRRTALWFK